jgi:hypothetical protein
MSHHNRRVTWQEYMGQWARDTQENIDHYNVFLREPPPGAENFFKLSPNWIRTLHPNMHRDMVALDSVPRPGENKNYLPGTTCPEVVSNLTNDSSVLGR